jgi:hypothetical protein
MLFESATPSDLHLEFRRTLQTKVGAYALRSLLQCEKQLPTWALPHNVIYPKWDRRIYLINLAEPVGCLNIFDIGMVVFNHTNSCIFPITVRISLKHQLYHSSSSQNHIFLLTFSLIIIILWVQIFSA